MRGCHWVTGVDKTNLEINEDVDALLKWTAGLTTKKTGHYVFEQKCEKLGRQKIQSFNPISHFWYKSS